MDLQDKMLRQKIHEAMQKGDVDALVEVRNKIHSLKSNNRRDVLLALLIRAYYVCNAKEYARKEIYSYVDDNLNIHAAAIIRKMQLILDRELSYSQSDLLRDAKFILDAGHFDLITYKSIVQRLCNVSQPEFRSTPENHAGWYRQVATLVSQKSLTTKPIIRTVNVNTPENIKFNIPNTLNSDFYIIQDLCSDTIVRPLLTLYELRDVTLYRYKQSIAILQDGHFVSDLYTPDGIFSTCYADWTEVPIVDGPIPSILLLDHFPDKNYCHWHFDTLPRLMLLRNAFPESRSNAAVVVGKATPFTKESLGAFGVAPNQIFEIGDTARVQFSRLYVSSSSFADLRHPAQFGNSDILRALRDNLVSEKRPSAAHSKFFISRRDANTRKLANENDIQSALSPLGVQFIAPTELSYREQIATFSNASLIIGPHGAGLTNLLFARRGATIIELFPTRFGTAAYFIASVGLGHDYVYMVGDDNNGTRPPRAFPNVFARDDFTVSVDILENFVRANLSS